MKDRQDFAQEDGDGIRDFAARVLESLGGRSHASAVALRADLVAALAEGMVTQDETRIDGALSAFRRACISREAMADLYIPAAARRLGCDWVDDRMGFAGVTVGSARLQALARAIATRWEAEPLAAAGSLLLVVPPGEDHTLGAVIAAGQIRRLGLSVCLRLRPTAAEVAELVRSRSFDAVFLSVAATDQVEGARRLVASVRKLAPPEVAVVVGGAITLARDRLRERVEVLTGADHATGDVREALRACGLLPRTAEPADRPRQAERLRA